MFIFLFVVFFFKQKTAYEMRISDWSSDVCASDLKPVLKLRLLLNRQFGSVAVMALALGMVMYGSTYVIPQFLAIISDYNAFQTGLVIFWMGIPAFEIGRAHV